MKRNRKKGCPFCKSSPDKCTTQVGYWMGKELVRVICLNCGVEGPPDYSGTRDKYAAEVTAMAWSKWNWRG